MARLADIILDVAGQTHTIGANLLQFHAVRSSGPGGQNVNKVSSKVVLEFAFEESDLPLYAREKLRSQASRLSAEGGFVVRCDETRDQARNLALALAVLEDVVREALHRPKTRKKTKPSRGQRERRLRDKQHQSEKKNARRGGE